MFLQVVQELVVFLEIHVDRMSATDTVKQNDQQGILFARLLCPGDQLVRIVVIDDVAIEVG